MVDAGSEWCSLPFRMMSDGMPSARRSSLVSRSGVHGGCPDLEACLSALLAERPTPERCFEAYYLQRTRFEGIAERKIRQRQLTEDGNIEITGRALRGGA